MAARTRTIGVWFGPTAAVVAALIVARRAQSERADRSYFAGKHVAITGGTRGLGFVLAGLLLDCGAKVTVAGRSPESLQAALARWEDAALRAAGIVCDVRDRAACAQFVSQAQDRFGPIDVLVNNAGIIEVGPFDDQTSADFTAAMETHFWAPLATTLAVLPAMRARRSGAIVNVASIGGIVGVPHLAPYSASKFAQVGLTQALAAELAADGVSVTSVVPGLMRTGSPGHAIFKGRHRAEYAWFTIADALPILSVPARTAARRILRAVRRGEPQVVIGITARIAQIANALFPRTTALALRIAAALLPKPGGIGTAGRRGDASRSRWTENVITALNRRAMHAANQEPTTLDTSEALATDRDRTPHH